jgi:PAS domain S-box-containing protein
VAIPAASNGQQAEALDRLTRLQALTASLSEAATSEQVADAILLQAAAVLDACAGVVYLLSDDDSELVLVRSRGYAEEATGPWKRFPAEKRLPISDAVRNRQPVLLTSIAERDARYPEIARIPGVPAEGAIIALPLVIRERAIGGMGLRFPTDRAFFEQDRAFLLTVAGICAQALERARLYDLERAARQRAEHAEEAWRQSEERLRAIIDNCPSAIFVKDPTGRYLLANKACEVYSMEPVERAIGKTAYDYFPPGPADHLGADDRQVLQTGEALRYEAVTPVQGGTVAALTVKFPLRDASGRPYAVCGIATDITQLKRATEALRVSEERFTRFMQHLPGLAWIKDEQGRYVFANDAAVNAFGKPRSEIYGRTDDEVFPPATAAQFHENDRKALASGTGVRVVETLEQQDGVLHHSLVSKFLIPGPDGTAALVGGMAIDITEEMQTRAVLEESEERLRTLSNNLPDGAIYQVVADSRGGRRFLYISAGVERLFGVTPEEAMADATALYGLIHEDDRPRLAAAEEAAVRGLALFDCEFRSWTRSGDLRWLHCRSAPRRLLSGDVVWEGVMLDATARKKAEADLACLAAESEKRRRLYEAALSNTPDLVYVFDLDHRFVYVNEGLLRMWGRTWEEAIGKNCLELGYEPWHAARHDREIEQVVATRQAVKGEVPFTGTFGRRIYEYIFVPVVGDNGEVEAVAGTTRDVTERKALEGQLRDQAEQLRQADRRKDDFLATLAHELRNPLAPLRTGLQVMKLASGNTEAVEQARGMMERQMAVMVRLIDDLLDVSRITRGKLELRKQQVELASVVQSAVEASRPFIEGAGHRLTVSLPPEPVLLNADPTRLAQVFGNLLNNAAKYMDRGGQIILTARHRTGEVAVSVLDTGIGIAAEHLPRLFEMFSQLKTALERSQGGLGIGLSLVKGLVEMHGGTVEARSEGPGKGSEFIVRLPVAGDRLAPEPQEPGRGEQPAARHRRRILVADDNRDAADSLTMLLRIGGHEVHAVHDGEEAVDAAAWFRPDLALLDIGMPKLNGFEAARRIREQPWGGGMTLVAVTGWGQEEDKRRATEAGFDLHLIKPVDPAALEKVLADLKADAKRSAGSRSDSGGHREGVPSKEEEWPWC